MSKKTTSNPFKMMQKEAEKWLDLRKKTANYCQEIVNLINRSSFMSNNKVHNAFGDALMPSRLSALIMDEISEKSSRLHGFQNEMMQCLKQIAILQSSVFPIESSTSSSSAKNIPNSKSASSTPSSTPAIPQAVSQLTCLIEESALKNIITQMQQQTLLEMCIVEELCGPDENEIDDDDDDDDCDDYYDDDYFDNVSNVDSNNTAENTTNSNNNNNNQKHANSANKRRKNKINSRPIIDSRKSIIGDQDAAVTMLACFTYPPYLRVSELEYFIELK